MKNVLVVDDEQQVLGAIDETLKRKGYSITKAGSGIEALGKMRKDFFQAVITDVRMPEMDGMSVLKAIKEQTPQVPVIMLTGHGTVPDAVRALKMGAYDYLMKPFTSQQLVDVVWRATEKSPAEQGGAGRILADDVRMKELLGLVAHAAASEATVLIQAESGTGKELLARFANSNLPGFRCKAPVKAPFSYPKSSLSKRVSGIAAQFTQINGLFRRELFS